MTQTEHITVATINTFFGRAIKAQEGFKELAHADILLLQELYSPSTYGVEESLNKQGFHLLACGGHFGLGIAVRIDSDIQLIEGTVRESVFQKLSAFSSTVTNRYARHKLDYTDQGMLAAQIKTKQGMKLTVVSTHTPVVTAPRKRALFLRQMAEELQDPYYQDGALILAGDMNHYPKPKKADFLFRKSAGLRAVDLKGGFTWPSKNTGYLESKLNRFYGGQLDDILYREEHLRVIDFRIIDVESDHRAVLTVFKSTRK